MSQREVQRWPGFAEWLLALAAMALIAAEVQTRQDIVRVQSSTAYYFDTPWVPQLHLAATVLDVLVFLLVGLWIVTPWRGRVRAVLGAVCVVAIVLGWGELVYAVRAQDGAVYRLLDLPFRPINNLGVIGAQVFGTYLILRSPTRRLKGWRWFLVAAMLSIGLWVFQNVLWRIVSA